MVNHDRLFKELLTSFFYEFLELFFPSLAALIDRCHPPVFLDKESFGELPGDSKREQDLVARVRMLDGDASFILHTEHEAQNTGHFPARMHMYFSRSLERYGPPIYPIAIFSKRSRQPREGRYHLRFHDLDVLDFHYMTVELADMDWRKFVDQANPVASALVARMKIKRQDRPRVKLQCLRLLATLKLEQEKSALISRFIDTYLRLNRDEVRIFDKAVEQLPKEERQGIMRVTTSWKEEGRVEGLVEGRKEGLIVALKLFLEKHFGATAEPLLARLPGLDTETLTELLDKLYAGAELHELE